MDDNTKLSELLYYMSKIIKEEMDARGIAGTDIGEVKDKKVWEEIAEKINANEEVKKLEKDMGVRICGSDDGISFEMEI